MFVGMRYVFPVIALFCLPLKGISQNIRLELADPCFSSVGTGKDLESSDLITQNGDIVEWTGSGWDGANWKSDLALVPEMPPFCNRPVKAAWLGSGILWNLNGEGVAFRLNQSLVSGKKYVIYFNYASHGNSSDGSFSPYVSTSLEGKDLGYPVGRLNPAGNNWRFDSIVFTADFKQAGDEWIILHTRTDESSGIIQAQCPQENFSITADKSFCAGEEVKLSANFSLSNYEWNDGSGDKEIVISEDGTYWLESKSPCGVHRDTIEVVFQDCGIGVGVGGGGSGGGKKKGGGINLNLNFQFCWFGSCDDDDVPTGPPSPPIIVYNVLTINGDGYNETFYVDNVENGRWKLRVYNRYAQLVFEDLEYKNTWKPTELTAGVYYVILKDRNSAYKYTGTLTIIR
ncbi:MAG TPA: hypothetical protein DIW47_14400 [Bacteroidetes bacterium]|nr:hypothetical protein [Bacteroidota bacterium]